ncbi:MAG: 7TM-DISM domain-containing protein, partial [Comamonadaceae bacterium]
MKWFQSIRRYVVVLLLGAVCAWPFAADAAGYISQRGWLEDKSGTLTFPQVEAQAQAFVSFDGVLTRGYTASTYWIRLSI